MARNGFGPFIESAVEVELDGVGAGLNDGCLRHCEVKCEILDEIDIESVRLLLRDHIVDLADLVIDYFDYGLLLGFDEVFDSPIKPLDQGIGNRVVQSDLYIIERHLSRVLQLPVDVILRALC